MTARASTRVRVFNALKEKRSLSETAALLGIARSTVAYHAGRLVHERILFRQENAAGGPACYRRGARASLFEATNEPRLGRTGPNEQRNHRGEWTVSVRPWGALRDNLPDDVHRWPLGTHGTFCAEWTHTLSNGKGVRVRETKGKHNCTLLLQPPEEFTNGPAERDALDVEWARIVDRAMDELTALHGYERCGVLKRVSAIESAVAAPALARGVRVTGPDGTVHTDGSPGYTEAEADTRTIACAMAALPEFLDRDAGEKRDILARIEALQNKAHALGSVEACLSDLPLIEKMVDVLEVHQVRFQQMCRGVA